MTSQDVALWDINIALWVIVLLIVTKIFHLRKNDLSVFQLAQLSNEFDFLCGFRQNGSLLQHYQYITITLK